MHIKTETVVGLFILSSLCAFFYMTFQIGVFRLDKSKYAPYITHFKDISGLSKKGEVKIAGVKVGWIEDVALIEGGNIVRARIMIPREYTLYSNAQAIVRQEGLLGSKYLEIVPGDPLTPKLAIGGTLARDTRDIASIDDLMQSFKRVAANVEEVSSALRESLAGPDGSSRIKDTIFYFGEAARKIALASETLERLLIRNEENLNTIMSDVRSVIHDIKDRLPDLTDNLTRMTDKFGSDFLPSFKQDVHKVANQLADEFLPKFTQDLKRISEGIDMVSRKLNSDFLPSVADSAHQISTSMKLITDKAGSGLKNFDDVAQKINKGEGFLGKIINEDAAYYDIKSAIKTLRNSLEKFERIAIVLDSHVESLQGPAERRFSFHDAKGYVNVRVHPNEDYFYLAGLAFSQKGYINRTTYHYRYFDEKNNEVLPSELRREEQLNYLVARKEIACEKRDSTRLNLQLGKIFTDVALRIGLFEGSFGAAFDYALPMPCESFKWVTTLEVFDIRGRNRLFYDTRPHVKWLNKLFVTPNLYFTFGADDFISKFNKNTFVGAGLRFSDDDLKYILTRAPLKF
jgi:phospholipid/cholesterol/gamma-HCH transport system substrate-binding protein